MTTAKNEIPYTKLPELKKKKQASCVTVTINVLATQHNSQYSHKDVQHYKSLQNDSILEATVMGFDNSQAL